MKKKQCPNPNCNYHNNTFCDEGEQDVRKCSHYKAVIDGDFETEVITEKDDQLLTWTGNAMGLLDVPLISQRSTPKIIGIIGPPNAGKTTFLGTFYNLLHNGYSLPNHRFTGSFTIKGWEYIAYPMRFNSPTEVHFPPHTTSDSERFHGLLHLALKRKEQLRDVLLTDASGEWFVNWSVHPESENSRGARWIDKYADSFIFFIDCESLIGPDRGEGIANISNIAHRLKQNLQNRPVAIVWSKADKIDEIRDKIRARVNEELMNTFEKYEEFHVSTIPKKIPDQLVHENIIAAIDWSLERQEMIIPSKIGLSNPEGIIDYFLSYRN